MFILNWHTKVYLILSLSNRLHFKSSMEPLCRSLVCGLCASTGESGLLSDAVLPWNSESIYKTGCNDWLVRVEETSTQQGYIVSTYRLSSFISFWLRLFPMFVRVNSTSVHTVVIVVNKCAKLQDNMLVDLDKIWG